MSKPPGGMTLLDVVQPAASGPALRDRVPSLPFIWWAIGLALTAGFSWINHRYLRLPPSIGILVMGLASSTLLVLLS